jgi:murein DD-endopeptidase MepM/ murein hydrolase activator NlpD
MDKIRFLFKKALTPVTIMVIPHENFRSLNIKIPSLGIFLTLLLSAVGAFYILSLALNGFKYPALVEKVDFYTKQFFRWNSTALALKEVEEDFRRIFSLPSKEKILETIDTSYSGSIDIQNLMLELEKSAESVAAIKDYLRVQKDIYLAAPKGYPVQGNVTSGYGKRDNPITQMGDFHSGIDISASSGTPIQATATSRKLSDDEYISTREAGEILGFLLSSVARYFDKGIPYRKKIQLPIAVRK